MGYKEPSKPVKLFTLDTETRGLFGEVFRVGLYDGKDYYAFDTFEEMIPILDMYEHTENHIYVHNLDFDLAKIAPTLFNKHTVSFAKSIFINSSVATLHTDKIVLHDSYKLLPSSLDKLCEDFGLEENAKKDLTEYIKEEGYDLYNKLGEYDKKASLGNFFEKVPAHDPVLNEYLEYDCRSLYEIIEIIEEIAGIDLENLVFCPTTASLAMRVYKTNYPDDYKQAISTRYLGEYGQLMDGFARMAYYGGRTEMFKPHMEGGFHYDVNSLYPYTMKIGKFPVGAPLLYDGEDAKRKYQSWKRRGVGGGIAWVRVYVPENMYIPPLPRKDPSGKLLFPVGRIEGCWTFPEIMEAERVGCIVEDVIQVMYFQKCEPIFKDFVLHFEHIKNTSTGAKRAFAKLCQNSLYGKFGMNRKRTTFTDMEELDELRAEGTPLVIHHHDRNKIHIDFIEHEVETKVKYIQPHIAAYVTAYARILLFRGLTAQQKIGDVHYCDTDSIACTAEMEEDKVHDKEYGKWKLESIIDEGIFLQPKFYAERGQVEKKGKWVDKVTIKAKGIPKEVMETITFADYEKWLNIIKEGKQSRIDIFDGLKARTKFISALKNNEDLDRAREMRKSINLVLEQKRIVDYVNNTTEPHKRYDYGEHAGEVTTEEKDVFRKALEEYVDDLDVIKEWVEDIGYIKIPDKTSEYYEKYNSVALKYRRKYFRKAGVEIDVWCLESGINFEDLILEMEA